MNMKTNYALAVMIIGILAAGQAFAGKPSSAGKPSAADSDRKSEQRGQPERTQGRQHDADRPSSAASDRESEQRGRSERTQGRQRDAVADEPSAVGRDRESEQRGRSERTQGRQHDAIADEPSAVGSDRESEQRGRSERTRDMQRDGDERSARRSAGTTVERHEHFRDQHQAVVHDFYGEEFRHGRCPPGLARKQNGCMPPGLAKKWTVGQQLPREVIFHNLPTDLTTQLGQPPSGHRYVRVADEILLITSRTGMVIDAIPMVTDAIQGR